MNCRPARGGSIQSGVALIVVLIMLTAMTIAGVALVRVVDSANVISGNFAFRQATLNIADLGIEAAVEELGTILDAGEPTRRESPYPDDCATESPSNCRYFPARSVGALLDAKGLPKKGNIDGTAIQNIDWNGNDVNVPPDPQRPPENPALKGYSIRYVIDRQCDVAQPTDPIAQCINDPPPGGSKSSSGPRLIQSPKAIYYRVSVQVTGPRKTQSHVQVILGF